MKTKSEDKIERINGRPQAQGLYNPENERDACGVGFICNMNGERSHDIIHKALEILVRLTHRGAESSDNKTGDGAGLQIQLPHEFYIKAAAETGFELPEQGQYGTGLVFLPRDEKARTFCMETLESSIKENGQSLLGWRKVPVDSAVLGRIASESEPVMYQLFIGRDASVKDHRSFERELYIICLLYTSPSPRDS